MVKITDPDFGEKLAKAIESIGPNMAVTGEICAQGYLFEWLGKDLRQSQYVIRESKGIDVIALVEQQPHLERSVRYIPPTELGEFEPHYQAMLQRKGEIEIPVNGGVVSLPVIPVDYLIAMGLCSETFLPGWYTRALIKIGRDEKKFDGEPVRGILKALGEAEKFDRVKEMLYDF